MRDQIKLIHQYIDENINNTSGIYLTSGQTIAASTAPTRREYRALEDADCRGTKTNLRERDRPYLRYHCKQQEKFQIPLRTSSTTHAHLFGYFTQ
jgi:hypothetical protein